MQLQQRTPHHLPRQDLSQSRTAFHATKNRIRQTTEYRYGAPFVYPDTGTQQSNNCRRMKRLPMGTNTVSLAVSYDSGIIMQKMGGRFVVQICSDHINAWLILACPPCSASACQPASCPVPPTSRCTQASCRLASAVQWSNIRRPARHACRTSCCQWLDRRPHARRCQRALRAASGSGASWAAEWQWTGPEAAVQVWERQFKCEGSIGDCKGTSCKTLLSRYARDWGTGLMSVLPTKSWLPVAFGSRLLDAHLHPF